MTCFLGNLSPIWEYYSRFSATKASFSRFYQHCTFNPFQCFEWCWDGFLKLDKMYYTWASYRTNSLKKSTMPIYSLTYWKFYIFIIDSNLDWILKSVLIFASIRYMSKVCYTHWMCIMYTFGVVDCGYLGFVTKCKKQPCSKCTAHVENLRGVRGSIQWCALVKEYSAVCAGPCILFTQNNIVISVVIKSHFPCTHDRTLTTTIIFSNIMFGVH